MLIFFSKGKNIRTFAAQRMWDAIKTPKSDCMEKISLKVFRTMMLKLFEYNAIVCQLACPFRMKWISIEPNFDGKNGQNRLTFQLMNMQSMTHFYVFGLWNSIRKNLMKMSSRFRYKYSQLIISFGRHQVETLKRYERYSYTEFLSVCGGLLGLFLGLSALSIIKFTHNFAVRFVYVLKQSKSKQHVQLFHHKASNNCNSIRNNLCNQSNVNGRYYWFV